MRKNGINRELLPMTGGICAPDGFLTNGARCGFTDENKPDLAVIVAKKKCATAFVGANYPCQGAPVKITRKHLSKTQHARAILVNSGIANAFGENANGLCESVCIELAKRLQCDKSEVVIASTGLLGEKLSLSTFLNGLDQVVSGLDRLEKNRNLTARAIENAAESVKEFAFSFQIGDYPCKIGGLYKGNTHVCPNMATTLCFLTTDVGITPQMLQKALNASVNETLNQLYLDGVASPNDCVCIMASGTAGNYRIAEEDSEYKKFLYVLTSVLDTVCRTLVTGFAGGKKPLICKVTGAKSKRAARLIAKEIVSSPLLKTSIDIDALLCAICTAGEALDFNKAEISVCSSTGKLIVFLDGERILPAASAWKKVFDGADLEILVDFSAGNYSALAYACV